MGLEQMVEQAIFMTDQHIPYVDERSERMTLQYVENNKEDIKYIIFGGDSIDNPAMSKFPHRPEDDTLLQEEIDLFVEHVAKYHSIVPKAKIYVLAGNHDLLRFENVKHMNRSICSLRALQFKKLLKESIAEQGHDFNVTFKEGVKALDCYFTHGDPRIDPYLKGGATGVRRTAEMYPEPGNIVFGHKHQVISYPRMRGDSSVYSVGCMSDLSKLAEQYKSYHGYQNGFLVVTKDTDGLQIDNIEIKQRPLYMDGDTYD